MAILIVDDVEDYLNSLARALASSYEVKTAKSLKEAKFLMNQEIQLVLADVRLSEEDFANRDGILLLGYIRENFPNIPVIMISGYKDFDSAVEALNLGAYAFLKKPINLRELKETISSALSSKGN